MALFPPSILMPLFCANLRRMILIEDGELLLFYIQAFTLTVLWSEGMFLMKF